MERIPRQFYTQEFKQEAGCLVINSGPTVAEVSRRLSISQQTLRNWIKKHKSEGLVASGNRSMTDLEAENSLPGKELGEARKLEEERLKVVIKAAHERDGVVLTALRRFRKSWLKSKTWRPDSTGLSACAAR